nr:(Fe-S)-binding protein [Candidatus Sigynarchaeota archaeon]
MKSLVSDETKDVNLSITFHDPCITAREFNDTTTARYIFGKIPGLTLIEPFLHGVETQCCGMGGVSHVHHPAQSEAIGKQRLDQLVATGASKIVTACPACEEGFIIADKGQKDRVLDISEIIAMSL